ncbi:MAG: hypothetical protein AB1758_37780 [Candidatus Eremiobacterota bacterium]
MLLERLRRELIEAARRLAAQPVEPLLVVSDERLASPLALKLGIDPRSLEVNGEPEGGFLNFEYPDPVYHDELRRLLSCDPVHPGSRRMRLLMKMADDQGRFPCDDPPLELLTHPDERRLMRLAVWAEGGLVTPERLERAWNAYYEAHPILEPRGRVASARLALCRVVQVVLGRQEPQGTPRRERSTSSRGG